MVSSEHNPISGADTQRIRKCLRNFRGRMYQQALLQSITSAFFYALILLAILFFLNKLIPLPIKMLDNSTGVILVALLIGISAKERKDLSTVARVVDEKMQLSERLSTAFNVMQTDPQNEFARLQIRDTAKVVKNLDISEVNPYCMPKHLKLFPIPLLLIGLSFTISPLYEVPQPLTERQQQTLNQMIQGLEGEQVENLNLQHQIQATVKALRATTDLETAQRHLSDLKREVRKQQSEQKTITEVVETTQNFQRLDTNQLAEELEALAEQAELSPELQSELMSLFERLAADLPDSAFSDSLQKIQSKGVTAETLQDIVTALEKMEKSMNLAHLEAQLVASQKELALAIIDIEPPSGGVASREGTPGRNVGTREVQGTREGTSDSELRSESQSAEPNETDTETERSDSTPLLTGKEIKGTHVDGNRLTLTTNTDGNRKGFSRVFTGEVSTDAPAYLPFTDAVLNASRAYADAVENKRIPVRYQTQIKSYLEAISKKNEKEYN